VKRKLESKEPGASNAKNRGFIASTDSACPILYSIDIDSVIEISYQHTSTFFLYSELVPSLQQPKPFPTPSGVRYTDQITLRYPVMIHI